MFVDDIDGAGATYASLLNAALNKREKFNSIQSGDVLIGFHPADAKSAAGTVVPYFRTRDMELALSEAESLGFELYRGPINIENEVVAQVRNERDDKIGFVQVL
jgi:hypothetical protein